MTKSIAHRIVYSLMILSLVAVVFGLAACASPQENARSLLDRLEIDDGETGCVDLRAVVDLNPAPFLTSNASLILKKSKGEDAPEC